MLNAWKLQHIRCVQSDYGCYNVTEPPIDAPRDPLYKSDYEVLKVRVNFINAPQDPLWKSDYEVMKVRVNYWRTTPHFSLFLLFI